MKLWQNSAVPIGTVQVEVGLENLFTLQNIEVSINPGVICTGLYKQAFGTVHVRLNNQS